ESSRNTPDAVPVTTLGFPSGVGMVRVPLQVWLAESYSSSKRAPWIRRKTPRNRHRRSIPEDDENYTDLVSNSVTVMITSHRTQNQPNNRICLLPWSFFCPPPLCLFVSLLAKARPTGGNGGKSRGWGQGPRFPARKQSQKKSPPKPQGAPASRSHPGPRL